MLLEILYNKKIFNKDTKMMQKRLYLLMKNQKLLKLLETQILGFQKHIKLRVKINQK